MKEKEKLLSFHTKLKFIFSHSALKEGWDSPNLFQLCTLRDIGTERERRQGRRQWRKVNLAMDTAISDIGAVEFTPSSDGDSSFSPELPNQITEGEEIGTVTADGAYDTRRCHIPSSIGRPLRSSRSARTAEHGKRTARRHLREIKPFVPPGTTAGRS